MYGISYSEYGTYNMVSFFVDTLLTFYEPYDKAHIVEVVFSRLYD